jgi:pilus assembly protein TadC
MSDVQFLPISYKFLERLLRPLSPLLDYIVALFPLLEYDLERLDSEVTARQYIVGTLVSAFLVFIFFSLVVGSIAAASQPMFFTERYVLVIVLSAAAFGVLFFVYSMLIPSWQVQQRSGSIERDLLFAIRHLSVLTNAGVPLFAAMVSVSEERGALGYGMVSKEFAKIVKEVEAGRELSEALNDSAARTPSRYYERIMWQLSNSSKAGVPVNETLSQLLDYLSEEQKIALRNYGSQLSPLSLVYLLTTIVGPTLAIIFLMIISTLAAIPVTETLFVVILLILLVLQIFFLGLIRSRRPTVSL